MNTSFWQNENFEQTNGLDNSKVIAKHNSSLLVICFLVGLLMSTWKGSTEHSKAARRLGRARSILRPSLGLGSWLVSLGLSREKKRSSQEDQTDCFSEQKAKHKNKEKRRRRVLNNQMKSLPRTQIKHDIEDFLNFSFLISPQRFSPSLEEIYQALDLCWFFILSIRIKIIFWKRLIRRSSKNFRNFLEWNLSYVRVVMNNKVAFKFWCIILASFCHIRMKKRNKMLLYL